MKDSKRMIDNRKVHTDRQKGIERVLQKGKVEKTWQSGDMNKGIGKGVKTSFKYAHQSLTPRKG